MILTHVHLHMDWTNMEMAYQRGTKLIMKPRGLMTYGFVRKSTLKIQLWCLVDTSPPWNYHFINFIGMKSCVFSSWLANIPVYRQISKYETTRQKTALEFHPFSDYIPAINLHVDWGFPSITPQIPTSPGPKNPAKRGQPGTVPRIWLVGNNLRHTLANVIIQLLWSQLTRMDWNTTGYGRVFIPQIGSSRRTYDEEIHGPTQHHLWMPCNLWLSTNGNKEVHVYIHKSCERAYSFSTYTW